VREYFCERINKTHTRWCNCDAVNCESEAGSLHFAAKKCTTY